MDGHTGWEHDLTYTPIYDDVAKFFGQARAIYSITLMTDGPGPLNEEWFWQSEDVWRIQAARVAAMAIRRPAHSHEVAASGDGLHLRSPGAGAGGHRRSGRLRDRWRSWRSTRHRHALGALDARERGGQRSRARSTPRRHGAHALGLDEDLGAITTGRIADLIVLDKDPLADIRNTTALRFVMKGGVLYSAESLDELWPETRPFGPKWWRSDAMLTADDRPIDYWEKPATERRSP